MTSVSAGSTRAMLDAATALGAVALTVTDLDRSRTFYERVLGLRARELDDGELSLSAPDGTELLKLHGDAAAPALDRRATGLFHLAILVPSRLELARSLARLAATRWPLEGASDHLVSEALYLSDPDGNGIEIYHDRPRDQWPQEPDGSLRMATLALDLRGLLAEPERWAARETRIGHVHLQVSELEQAEAFYAGVLGFEVTVRGYPGALFVSAGGYHHHVGLNTWHSAGSGAPAPGAVGLRWFELVLAGSDELDAVLGRARAAGVTIDPSDPSGRVVVRDPFGIAVQLRSR